VTHVPHEVTISPRSPERFRAVLPPDRYAEFEQRSEEARALLADRVVWNVNSTARGGGVVELLRPLLAYARGAGIDARWLVLDGEPEFFHVTKRIHNYLHGSLGDGGTLDDRVRRVYEDVLAENTPGILAQVRSDDVVILHDAQPAGLLPALRAAGVAALIWRCHVGVDRPNTAVRSAWEFLLPYVREADVCVFHREAFVWDGLDRAKIAIIEPTIDVFTPKNCDIDDAAVAAILRASAIVPDGLAPEPVTFERTDGTPGRLFRRARIVEDEPLRPDMPLVVQVSRWDALKDPVGVIRGFGEHVPGELGAHLVCAGPDVSAVEDDPEGARVLRLAVEERGRLDDDARRRVHLVSLPMDDLDENALMVNALQRHAAVVAQKSVAEGFGLTVAEAMWKARPVVASRVGGIQEQITNGQCGILVDDPTDLAGFGAALTDLLRDRERAEELGRRARERVRDHFLSVRSLIDYFAVIRSVIDPGS
jgi:trehalose synthase